MQQRTFSAKAWRFKYGEWRHFSAERMLRNQALGESQACGHSCKPGDACPSILTLGRVHRHTRQCERQDRRKSRLAVQMQCVQT